jgi:hypothetical protein
MSDTGVLAYLQANPIVIFAAVILVAIIGFAMYYRSPADPTNIGDFSLVLGSDAPKIVSYADAKKVSDCLQKAKGQPVIVFQATDENGDTAVTSCGSYPSITGMTRKAPGVKGTYTYANQTIPLATA